MIATRSSDGTITANFEKNTITYNYTLIYDSPQGGGTLWWEIHEANGQSRDSDFLDDHYSEYNLTLNSGETLVLSDTEWGPDSGVEFLGWFDGVSLLSSSTNLTIDPTQSSKTNRTITAKYGTKAPKPEEKHWFAVFTSASAPVSEPDVYIDDVYQNGIPYKGGTKYEYTGQAFIRIEVIDDAADHGWYNGYWFSDSHGRYFVDYTPGSPRIVENSSDWENGTCITFDWSPGDAEW